MTTKRTTGRPSHSSYVAVTHPIYADWRLRRKADPYGFWRAQNLDKILAIVAWAEKRVQA
jgi:hypothetical protein